MHRITVRLIAALITFCAGVVIAVVWIASRTPDIDPVAVFESAAPVLPSRCFSGLSQKTDQLKPAEGRYFPEGPPCQDCPKARSTDLRYILKAVHPRDLRSPDTLA
jgi:hypothetical protein